MSFKTWKEEFYPVSAEEVDPEQAAQHSLKKWEGMRRENLKRHNMTYAINYRGCLGPDYQGVRSRNNDAHDFDLVSDSGSCALCVRNFDDACDCDNCPIVKLGFPDCDRDNSAYRHFRDKGDPEPMIQVLQEVVEFENKNKSPVSETP